MLNERLDKPLKLIRVARVHLRQHRAGIDGVNGTVLRKLPRPRASHSLDGGLGTAVDRLADEPASGANGAQVDDAAAAVRREVRLGGLDEEERAEDVDLVGNVKVGDLDVGDLVVVGDAGVVDDDVDLELAGGGKGGLGGGDELGGARRGGEVGLDDESADLMRGFELF